MVMSTHNKMTAIKNDFYVHRPQEEGHAVPWEVVPHGKHWVWSEGRGEGKWTKAFPVASVGRRRQGKQARTGWSQQCQRPWSVRELPSLVPGMVRAGRLWPSM